MGCRGAGAPGRAGKAPEMPAQSKAFFLVRNSRTSGPIFWETGEEQGHKLQGVTQRHGEQRAKREAEASGLPLGPCPRRSRQDGVRGAQR